MSSFIQYIKQLISGNTPRGIQFRTILSVILTFSVLIIEIAIYAMYWDAIPNMIQYDYDFSGKPNDIFEKQWIWYNLLLQIFICAFVFIVKYLSYKTKRICQIVYDKNNHLIPIMDKRFSMFAWETAMLFVTTEQGYIFTLVDIIEGRMCDDIVTLIFLFWMSVLIIEFRFDIKAFKKAINPIKCGFLNINQQTLPNYLDSIKISGTSISLFVKPACMPFKGE